MELFELEPSPMAPYVTENAVVTHAEDGSILPVEECEMCHSPVLTMCFKGTGVCGENCHKLRKGQLVIEEPVRGAA